MKRSRVRPVSSALARRALGALPLLCALWVLLEVGVSRAGDRLLDRPGVAEFVATMVGQHGFAGEDLERVLGDAAVLPSVLEAMGRPAEARPWHEYRKIFLTPERVDSGVEFWRENRAALERAAASYGVAAEVIVAIIGVETRYGRNTGSFRVIDSLSTLAFAGSRRTDFFRDELEQFLLLAREEGIPPLSPKGSYAGAMGIPQFISSSFRRYAVDFDHDGQRDLWRNPSDAIGSVANYLRAHGWRRGGLIALRATVRGPEPPALAQEGLKPTLTSARLRESGVSLEGEVSEDELGTLVQLETPGGFEYWVGFQNFYAITRYNHSSLYAMAVFQLARELSAAYGQPVA
jgi:membrane-bound lytic murein transglycosylase B